jgi:hypothetical protein
VSVPEVSLVEPVVVSVSPVFDVVESSVVEPEPLVVALVLVVVSVLVEPVELVEVPVPVSVIVPVLPPPSSPQAPSGASRAAQTMGDKR